MVWYGVVVMVCVHLVLKEHFRRGGTKIQTEDQEFYCEIVSLCTMGSGTSNSHMWSPNKTRTVTAPVAIPEWMREVPTLDDCQERGSRSSPGKPRVWLSPPK